jgi:fatty acyl-CoA reductase
MDPVQADLFPELSQTPANGYAGGADEVCIGGRSGKKRRRLRWVLRQPNGSAVIRLFGYIVAKVLRRIASEVTFDRSSFESALARVPEGTLVIIAPTHRSYMDFLLCSYLFFDQPELGIAIPHIAAAEEFSHIRILGRLFEQAQAFFVKRGMHRQDYVELTTRVTDLVKRRQTLQVFIEGTRSRSGQFLPPHHGLLKCIQETGQPVTILPVALSYERVTEEASFLRQLQGNPKPEMRLAALSGWATRMLTGKIKIGRVHIACGAPVKLDKFDRLRSVTEAVMAQLQAKTVTTTFHLRSFLECNPIEEIDLDWLSQAIEARGGSILDSTFTSSQKVTVLQERCMRYHWMHLFYTEARAAFPDNPAVQHHIARNGFLQTPTVTQSFVHAAKIDRLLFELFAPICREYALVAESLGTPGDSLAGINPDEILRRHSSAFLPDLEAAFEALLRRRILAHGEHRGTYKWGRRAAEIFEFREMCKLTNFTAPPPERTNQLVANSAETLS